MATPIIRIHPAIGFSRVGNSSDYYLAPDTSAGLTQPGSTITGGLPIKPGTEATPVSDADLRDAAGALKRQAQRFRLYQYNDAQLATQYPYTGTVSEIIIGSSVASSTPVAPATNRPRDPAEVRGMLSGFRAGVERGRAPAVRTDEGADAPTDPTEPTDPTDEQRTDA